MSAVREVVAAPPPSPADRQSAERWLAWAAGRDADGLRRNQEGCLCHGCMRARELLRRPPLRDPLLPRETCPHERVVPVDAEWAQCLDCGDATFPLVDPGYDPDEDLGECLTPAAARRPGRSENP